MVFESSNGWTNKVSNCKFDYMPEPSLDATMLKTHLGAKCLADCKVTLSAEDATKAAANLKYSTDKTTWSSFEQNKSVQFKRGDTIYFKGNNSEGFSRKVDETGYTNYIKITEGQMSITGNIVGLMNDGTSETTTLTPYCFHATFEGSTGLVSINDLIVPDTVTDHMFALTFKDCTNLTEVPATLFKNTTLQAWCYCAMFMGCTKITTLPTGIFPNVTLAEACYFNMFNGCTSLTSVPELQAQTLAKQCYYRMFSGCTNLVTALELPATTLAENCCIYMFKDCTSLTTAPELLAQTLVSRCYELMFEGCSSLNKVEVDFDEWIENATGNWLSGVAANGEFICKNTVTERHSATFIPEGWTVTRQ